MPNVIRKRRRLGLLFSLAATLAAIPAYAGFRCETLEVLLSDVSSYGNLKSYCGQEAPFLALLNTRNGTFCGSAHARVSNQSGRFQCYKNVNLFDDFVLSTAQPALTQDGNYVSVNCSLYTVDYFGFANYCATGRIEFDD